MYIHYIKSIEIRWVDSKCGGAGGWVEIGISIRCFILQSMFNFAAASVTGGRLAYM